MRRAGHHRRQSTRERAPDDREVARERSGARAPASGAVVRDQAVADRLGRRWTERGSHRNPRDELRLLDSPQPAEKHLGEFRARKWEALSQCGGLERFPI